jgi:ABC-type lipoprotein release transport system permease subunit
MIETLPLLWTLAWRNLWRNPRRTGITLAVVATGIWSILIFNVMIQAVADSGKEESLRLLTGEVQIHAPGFLDDPNIDHRFTAPDRSLLAALNGPGVAAWAPRVRTPAVIESEYRTRAITLLGVSPGPERGVSDLPGQILRGRYLGGPGDPAIVIGADLARRLETRVGKRVIIMAQGADGRMAEAGFKVVGLFGNTRPAQDAFVFTGLAPARTMLGMGASLSEISLDVAHGADPARVAGALRAAAPGLDIQPWMTLSPLAFELESVSKTYVGVWLAIMFVLMAIGIVNTQLMAVFERTREFGLSRALGLRSGMIVLQVSLESAMLVGLGVVAGLVLALAVLGFVGPDVDLGAFAGGAAMAGIGEVLHPRLDAALTVACCLIVWVLGILAALWPAAAAARASPAAAMRAA